MARQFRNVFEVCTRILRRLSHSWALAVPKYGFANLFFIRLLKNQLKPHLKTPRHIFCVFFMLNPLTLHERTGINREEVAVKKRWWFMEKEARPKILLYQSMGFLSIIGLSWLDEYLGLTELIFGDHSYIPEFHASLLAMLFILAVWLLVAASTRRILDRVKYLEGFLKVCAWCRRIDHKGSWMPLEEFMKQGFDTPTSHGICKDCLAIQKAAAERAREAKRAAAQTSAA